MKKAVVLINPFTSVELFLNFIKSKGIAACAFFTKKKLKRSGYVLTELNKAKFDWRLYSCRHLPADVNIIKKCLHGYQLIYCFIGSELDDYVYSEQLAHHLLPQLSNDPQTAELRYNKYLANETLQHNNIQCVKQVNASTYQRGDIQGATIIKPIMNSCSADNVAYFADEHALIHHLKKTIPTNYVVQERIFGDEYIVDCFSFQGKHSVIGFSKYECDNKNLPLLQHVSTATMTANLKNLGNYAISVLDALHVENGFSHLEIMINEHGCYLIELNPRLPGACGFVSHLYEFSYHKSHLNVWYDLVVQHTAVAPLPTLTACRASVFLLNNYKHAYDQINVALIKKLPSYKKLKIINEKADKPKTYSRLNTVAFVLLANDDTNILNANIQQLIKYEDEGDVFNSA